MAVTQLGASSSQLLNSDTLTSFVAPAGTNRLLVVTASDSNSTDVTGVTFGGTPLTPVTNGERTDAFAVDSIWYMTLGTSASTTTGNIVMTDTGSGNRERFLSAVVFDGVDQATPVSGAQNNQAFSSNSSLVVSSAVGDLVYDIFDVYKSSTPPTPTIGGGQTLITSKSGTLTSGGNGLYNNSTEPGASSVTMSWTSDGEALLHVAVNIKQATSSGTITATLSSGNLTITDTDGTKNNSLTAKSDGLGNLVITDLNEQFNSGVGTLSNGNKTLTIPLASVTGNLVLNTAGGDDSVTVDLSGGDAIPTGGIQFNGGSANDKLAIVGGSQGTVTYNYTNANDGSVDMSNFGKVQYTGLEPISNTGSATNIIFNLPTGDGNNNATLGDNGLADGVSKLSGTGFETTLFANPTTSLTVNFGNDGETFTLAALDSSFAASSIDINGGTVAEIVNVLATPASATTTVSVGNGMDIVNVSSNGAALSGNLNGLDGLLRVDGGATGNDVLNISESGNASADTVSVSSTSYNGTSGGGWNIQEINFGFSGGVNLSLGSASDIVSVVETLLGQPLTINGNGGADTAILGNGGNSLDPFSSNVTFNAGGQASDILTINDQGDFSVNSYTVNATQVSRSGGPTIIYSGLGLGNLNLNGGTAANTYTINNTAAGTTNIDAQAAVDQINILGTASGTNLSIFAGSGLDNINVGNNGTVGAPGLLTPVAGAVTLDGEADGANLTVDGSGAAVAADYEISSTTVTRSNPVGFGGVTYSNLIGGSLLLTVGGGANVVSVNSTAASVPTNIATGAGDDSIVFANGVSLNGGTVDGGADNDTINYSAYTTPVAINLGMNVPGGTLVADIEGTQENPGQVTTATGTANVTYNATNKTFDISVTVSNLSAASVTGYHIHRAPVGVNGPIIVDLAAIFGLGALVASGSGFTFNATGVALPPQHEAAFLGGLTYVNFHTVAAPGGLIRGQIFPNGVFTSATGSATGTGGVSNIENADGGSNADSLVGTTGINTLNGNGGSDTIVGGPGNDNMNGGASVDVLVWSNGDNSDVIDGGADADTVQINGSISAGDIFTVGNGSIGRVAFARTNLVPFALDIGTAETLTVNGINGDDTMTVNSLSAVSNLTKLDLNGQSGSDSFNVTVDTAVAINVNGYSPVAPSTPGDALTVDAGGANAVLSVSAAAIPVTTISIPGKSPINFLSIETPSVTNAVDLTVNGSTNADTLTLQKDGNGNAVYILNGAPPVILNASGQFLFNGNDGSDLMIVDFTNGNPLPSGGVSYDGGNGVTDKLKVTGGTFSNVTHNFTNANSGNIQNDALPLISYQNLEPVDQTGSTVTNLIFNLPAATSNVSLGDDGTLSNGNLRISSLPVTFETTDFTAPTGSLTINRGNSADSITINSIDDFDVAASLAAGTSVAKFNSVSVAGTVSAASLSLSGETISNTASANVSVSGSAVLNAGVGGVTLGTTAGDQINFGSVSVNSTAGVTLNEDSSILVTSVNAVSSVVLTAGGTTSAIELSGGSIVSPSDVQLKAGSGGIGTNSSPVIVDTPLLTSNTALNSGPQFLTSTTTTAVSSGDLSAGTATITLKGGTFNTATGGSDILSNVVVSSGATLGGTGTVTGTVQVNAGGTVSPGLSPGILSTGSVTYSAASTMVVEVNGQTPGTAHDQLNVTGTIALNNANLSISGSVVSAANWTIVILNNDGTDPVTGTFNGLPEGSTVVIGGVNFKISYVGGTNNNDVVLISPPQLPPNLINPGDQTTPNGATDVIINLIATDPNNDPLTYSAMVMSLESVIDQQYGLSPADLNMYFNWGGLREKWFKGTSYPWLYITPDGKLYAWRGGSIIGNDILVEQFSVDVYNNPQLLFNPSNSAPVSVSVVGNVLTINPNDNFIGKFFVTAKVDDGFGGTDSEQFVVTVAGPSPDTTPPAITNLSPIAASAITGSTINLDVAFSEPVVGVDATDLVLTGTASVGATKGTPVHVGGNVWRFPISNLVNGTLNVQLAPDPNDIEDAAGNDLATSLWSYTVSLSSVQFPPVLNPIANQSLPNGQVNAVVNLVAVDPNNDPLSFSATADSLERYLDQTHDLRMASNEFLNWGGLNEKWMLGNGGWFYILPNGSVYRWLGGSVYNASLIEQVNPAAYHNTALLYNAAANNSNAVLSIVGQVLTVNPADNFSGKIAVTARVNDGHGGTDAETFFVIVGLSGPVSSIPSVTSITPAPGSTISTSSPFIDIVFSEPVARVESTDLVLGGGASLVSVVGLAVPISANAWRFPVTHLANGSLTIVLAPDEHDIQDLDDVDLGSVSWNYLVAL